MLSALESILLITAAFVLVCPQWKHSQERWEDLWKTHNPDFYLFQSCLFSSNAAFILKNLKAGQGSQKRHDNLKAFAIKAVLPEKLRTHSPTSATESYLSLQIPYQRHLLKTLSVVGRCSNVLLISAPKEFLFRMEEGTLPLGEGASASPKG